MKYTFTKENFVEYLNTQEFHQEFVIDDIAYKEGLFELDNLEFIEARMELEIEFQRALVEYLHSENKRLKIERVFMKCRTWIVKVHTFVLERILNIGLQSGLIVRNEETESLFQEYENEKLMKSFK